jgi:hypothetical protein
MTAPALAILARCRRLGITLAADGDLLRYRPVGAVGPDLLRELARHKAAILAALAVATGAACDRPEAAIPYRPPAEWDAADRAAVAWFRGERESFRPRSEASTRGVPAGWTAASWVHRLRYLAAACQGVHPGLAATYRAQAAELEAEG